MHLTKVTTYVLTTSGFASNITNYITVNRRKGIFISVPVLNPGQYFSADQGNKRNITWRIDCIETFQL